jgi:hypothetical protein
MFGGVLEVGKDVEEAVEVEEIEEAFDDAGCARQNDGCLGFVSERCHAPEQGSDAGAVEERGCAEVDHQTAMTSGDRAFDCVFEFPCVGKVELARNSHVRPLRAEGFSRYRGSPRGKRCGEHGSPP